MQDDVLTKIKLKPFSPPQIWRSPHWQTIGSFAIPTSDRKVPEEIHKIALQDEEELLLVESSNNNSPDSPIVLLAHGLSGCYQSNFMVRLNHRFFDLGFRSFRLNLRGCGPGWKLAKKPSHAGLSQDLRETIQWIKRHYEKAPITVIGFSLGANQLLKLLGEDGEGSIVDRFIAVSPPLDLQRAVNHLSKKENQIYSRFFTHRLKKDIQKIQNYFPELKKYDVSKCQHVVDVDELYTAPLSGYSSASEYYQHCSSMQFVEKIRKPGLILGALDDPIIDGSVYNDLEHNPFIQHTLTERGGHVGFLDSPRSKNMRWMDEWIVRSVLNWEEIFVDKTLS